MAASGWNNTSYKERREIIERNREKAGTSGVLDPNGGLHGMIHKRFLDNQDRNWQRKVRKWDTEKQEKERLEEEEAEKKRKEQEKNNLAAQQATQNVFQPSG